MKLDKNQQKLLISSIRTIVKKKGYRIRDNSIYTTRENAYIFYDFLIVNSQKMIYRMYIKEYDYDNIFWKIMQMEDNAKHSDSLRACGAFRAPSVLLKKGEMELTNQYDEQAEYLVGLLDEYSHKFMQNYNIDEYIIHEENDVDDKILECLAYLHMGKTKEAIEIAQDSIAKGDEGEYKNEGKTFFEWLLLEV